MPTVGYDIGRVSCNLLRVDRAPPYDHAVLNVIIGAVVALVGGFGLEMLRSWQQRRASWREMQATTMTELQELLCTIKDEIAKGKPSKSGAVSAQAPSESDLEIFAPRTRARMLCSRLSDKEFGTKISNFLGRVKNDSETWRHNYADWLRDQEQFASYCSEIGERLQVHKPCWIK